MEPCENCGCTQCADYVKDPYQDDMNDVVIMRWLCSECYRDIAGDI